MRSRCLARVKCTVYALYAINRSSSSSDTALVHDVLTATRPPCGEVPAPVSFPGAFDEGERRRGRAGRVDLKLKGEDLHRKPPAVRAQDGVRILFQLVCQWRSAILRDSGRCKKPFYLWRFPWKVHLCRALPHERTDRDHYDHSSSAERAIISIQARSSRPARCYQRSACGVASPGNSAVPALFGGDAGGVDREILGKDGLQQIRHLFGDIHSAH
jgi:hypothetical protein